MIKSLNDFYRAFNRLNRNIFHNNVNRKKLTNKDFSIISNNCLGSLISHDLNQQFNTPTVNLFMGTSDFIKFVKHLEYYLNADLKEIFSEEYNYPLGKLDDNIEIHFMHYPSFDEAKRQWERRKTRVNFENLFILMTDNDRCNSEDKKEFLNLPYKNKAFLTNDDSNINESDFYYIRGFESENHLGDLTVYTGFFGKKIYDEFDYISWLNKSKKN